MILEVFTIKDHERNVHTTMESNDIDELFRIGEEASGRGEYYHILVDYRLNKTEGVD